MNTIIEGVLKTIDSSILSDEEEVVATRPLSMTVKYLDNTTKVLDEETIVELQKTMDVKKQKQLFHDVKEFDDAGNIKYHATFDANGRSHGFYTYIYADGTKITQQRVHHGRIIESAEYMADTNAICSYTRYYKHPSGKPGMRYHCEYDDVGYKHGTESLNFDSIIEWEHGVEVGSVALQAINEIHNDVVNKEKKLQEKIEKLEAMLSKQTDDFKFEDQDDHQLFNKQYIDELKKENASLTNSVKKLARENNKQCIDELKKENTSLMDAVKKLARENTYFQNGLVQKENEELKSQLTELKRIINGIEKS